MALITLTYIFSAGATIIASQHNVNNSTIYNDYNGDITNANIASTAAIAYSKLNLTSGIVDSDISASANISNSKLAPFTTPGLISGAILTSLSSIPSGAGIIPAANLPTPGAITPVSQTILSGVATSGNIAISDGTTYFVKYNLYNLSSSQTIILRFNGDSGSNYVYVGQWAASDGTSGIIHSTGTTSISLSPQIAQQTYEGITGSFYIRKTTTQIYNIAGQSSYMDAFTSTVLGNVSLTGNWAGSATVTSFALLTSGGATMTGTVDLYQIAIG